MDDMPGMSGAGHHAGGMWSMTGPMWMPRQPPTPARLLDVHLQPVPMLPLLGILLLLVYLLGVVTLRRRGAGWSWARTISWIVGVVMLEAVTATGVEGYGMMMFSVHMAQHMVVAMVIPILLALGSPYVLALQALPRSGVAGQVRALLVGLASSRAAALLCWVPTRWALFLTSLYGIYFTPLFGGLMHTVWGHNLLLLHFLLTGCLFFGPLVGTGVRATRAVRRLGESFACTPLHAAFGLSIMVVSHPVVRFFDHPDPSWGLAPLNDQTLAGSIAWATSEAATVLVMGILLTRWWRACAKDGPTAAAP